MKQQPFMKCSDEVLLKLWESSLEFAPNRKERKRIKLKIEKLKKKMRRKSNN